MKLGMDDSGVIDLVTENDRLASDTSLETAIIISLLTDRRARLDDRLPDDVEQNGAIPPDRRGWCGDALAEIDGDRIGSRLWLLTREKQTEETRRRAVAYAREALQWLIDDGVAEGVEVSAEWQAGGRLNMLVVIVRPDGSRFETIVQNAGGSYAV